MIITQLEDYELIRDALDDPKYEPSDRDLKRLERRMARKKKHFQKPRSIMPIWGS